MVRIGKWKKVNNEQWINTEDNTKICIINPKNSESGKWETIFEGKGQGKIVSSNKHQAEQNAFERQRKYLNGLNNPMNNFDMDGNNRIKRKTNYKGYIITLEEKYMTIYSKETFGTLYYLRYSNGKMVTDGMRNPYSFQTLQQAKNKVDTIK